MEGGAHPQTGSAEEAAGEAGGEVEQIRLELVSKAAESERIIMKTVIVLMFPLLPLLAGCASRIHGRPSIVVAAVAQEPEPLGPDITPPVVSDNRQYPQYSDTARRLGVEGTVIVQTVVHKDGSVSVVGTKDELGYGLDENAILAVRHLRLQPAMKNGVPVDVAVDIPIDFRLDDARENHPVNPPSFIRQLCTSVKPPQPVLRIQPEYTEIAKRDRVTGVVSLDVVVRKDGTVDVSRVAESLDHGLDWAAVDALSRWVFTPRICDGAPLETPLNLEVNFNLR